MISNQSYPRHGTLLNAIDSNDSDAVAWDDTLAQVSVAEELQVARHLTVGNCLGRFLKFEDLKVDAFALVWDDEVRVDRTFDLTRLCAEA